MSRIGSSWILLVALGAGCSGEVGTGMDTPPGGSTMTGPNGTAPSPSDSTSPPSATSPTGMPIPGGTGVTPTTTPTTPGAPTTPGVTPTTPTMGTTAPPANVPVEEAPALPLRLDGVPLYARALRLTHDQWENSVRYLLAMDETGHRGNLAEDVSGLYDFSNHEELLFMNANLYRDYQMAAEELVAIVGSDANAISAIYGGMDAEGFIETVGRRAFRRPLTAEEQQALRAVYDGAAELTENGATPHARGVSLVLQALLQSPYFLYRLETGAAGTRLSSYEMAAKLSLLILDVTPNDELLDRAAAGELDTDAGVLAIATEMLGDEAAAITMQQFHGELFAFNRYLAITKNAELVPEYRSELNEELQQAAYLFFDRIFRDDLGVADILTTTVGFVGPNMASLYGVNLAGQGLQEMELGPERPGFFTHLPFLILNAVNLTPDSIHRGVALNNEVLCGEIPPPPDAMVALNPAVDGQTNRERVTATSGVGTCGQPCHAPYINPLGFAFENYDGMGRLRDTDNGLPVDTSSAYPFAEGRIEFDGAPSLMQVMAEGSQAHACYAKHLSTFALQRELTEADRPTVDSLAADSLAGASLKGMILSLVTSPVFTTSAAGGTQ